VLFVQTYGQQLNEAEAYTQKYLGTRMQSDLNRATDLYNNVLRKLVKEVNAMSLVDMELEQVSPQLMAARDLELAVPGQCSYEMCKNVFIY